MTVVPGSTSMSLPSMVSFGMMSRNVARLVGDVVVELAPELRHEGLHGPGRRVPERADRVAGDVAGDVEQRVGVAWDPLAPEDPRDDLLHPAASLATRGALPARLVRVEARDVVDRAYHADGAVHDDDAGRAEKR